MYPMGAEHASVVLLEAAPLREKPLKQRVFLNDVRFSPGPVRMATTKSCAGRHRGELDWSKSYMQDGRTGDQWDGRHSS